LRKVKIRSRGLGERRRVRFAACRLESIGWPWDAWAWSRSLARGGETWPSWDASIYTWGKSTGTALREMFEVKSSRVAKFIGSRRIVLSDRSTLSARARFLSHYKQLINVYKRSSACPFPSRKRVAEDPPSSCRMQSQARPFFSSSSLLPQHRGRCQARYGVPSPAETSTKACSPAPSPTSPCLCCTEDLPITFHAHRSWATMPNHAARMS
jgi:hypothetical protein